MRLIGCARGCSGEKGRGRQRRGNLDITVFISAVIAPGALLAWSLAFSLLSFIYSIWNSPVPSRRLALAADEIAIILRALPSFIFSSPPL